MAAYRGAYSKLTNSASAQSGFEDKVTLSEYEGEDRPLVDGFTHKGSHAPWRKELVNNQKQTQFSAKLQLLSECNVSVHPNHVGTTWHSPKLRRELPSSKANRETKFEGVSLPDNLGEHEGGVGKPRWSEAKESMSIYSEQQLLIGRDEDREKPMTNHSDVAAVRNILGLLGELKYKIRASNASELRLLQRIFNNDKIQRAVILNHKISERLKAHEANKPLTFGSKSLATEVCAAISSDKPHDMKESTEPIPQLNHAFLPGPTEKYYELSTSAMISPKLTDSISPPSFEMIALSQATTDDVTKSDDVHELRDSENNTDTESRQLCDILESSHVSAVLSAHDEVAVLKRNSQSEQADADCSLEISATNKHEGGDTAQRVHEIESSFIGGQQVKIITMHKSAEPLGATVRNEGEAIVIARIIKGGIAEKTRLLKQGDEILQINSVDIRGQTIDEVADLMTSLSGDLKFVTKPSSQASLGTAVRNAPRREITVRAMFDYDAADDPFIPCVELGITFHIGDILHIINRDDPHWWQARRVGDDSDCLAGLIPSKLFWEMRQHLQQTILAETESTAAQKKTQLCCPTRRTGRSRAQSRADHQPDLESVLTYEEVGLHYPQPLRRRPVVLVGCEDLRLQGLCQMIASVDKQRFKLPVKTSSHPSMFSTDPHKAHGPPLHYLPHEKFIDKIKQGDLIEYRVLDSPAMHYIGVSKGAVKDIISSGSTCLLNCQPKSIAKLRTAEISPYIIFVAAPHIKKLKTLLSQETKLEPSNEECKHIIDLSRHNESTYSHMYDYVMTLTDAESACKELLKVINDLEVEPQWVPIEWVPQKNGVTNSAYECSSVEAKSEPTIPDLTISNSEADHDQAPGSDDVPQCSASNNQASHPSPNTTAKLAKSPGKSRKYFSSPKISRKSPKCSPSTFRKPKTSPQNYRKLVNSPEESKCFAAHSEAKHDSDSAANSIETLRSGLDETSNSYSNSVTTVDIPGDNALAASINDNTTPT